MKKYIVFAILTMLLPAISSNAVENNKVNILVKFHPGVSENAQEKLYDRFGAKFEDELLDGQLKVLSVSERAADAVVRALSDQHEVEFAEIDQLRELNLDPNDPLIGNEYYIDIINAPEAWDISTGDAIVLVSAPDTGIRSSHEDLQDVLRMDLAFNTVNNSNDTSPVHSHGTSTAGMISARTDNATGIASAQWADTLHHIPIRVSNRGDGNAYDSDIVEAIEYAADNGAKSISISYSGIGSSARREAGAYARNLGALFFNSAGNGYGWEDPQDGDNWEEIIAVSSTNSNDTLSGFSSYGPYVDIAAPGSSTLSTYYSADDAYKYVSGTSFSSPLTASVAAYLFSAYPEATNLQVEQALYEGAEDLGDPGWDEMFGHGRVDSYGAIVRLQQILNFTDEVPPTVSIESPLYGATVQEDISVDVLATDAESGIDYVELYIDGLPYGTDSVGDNDHYIFFWDLTNYDNGQHSLKAIAYDNYGNSAENTITVNVGKLELVPPTISIVDPSEGQCTRGDVAVETLATDTQKVDFYKATTLIGTDTTYPFSWLYNFRSKGKPKSVLVRVVAWNGTYSAEDSITVTDGGCDGGGGGGGKTPQCSDGKDNDKDGFIDWPNDLQCTDANDTNERK